MSSEKVKRPASSPASTSGSVTRCGGMNCGGCSAETMRPDSAESSSSTTAMGTLLMLSGMPVAAIYTWKLKA
jgi:hypothetical protein